MELNKTNQHNRADMERELVDSILSLPDHEHSVMIRLITAYVSNSGADAEFRAGLDDRSITRLEDIEEFCDRWEAHSRSVG